MNQPRHKRATKRFPSPEERERIIQRRVQLTQGIISAMVARDADLQRGDVLFQALVADYGAAEVERMLTRIRHNFSRPRDPDEEERWLYNEYVQLHRRFGGTRPLQTPEELETLKMEHAKFLLRRDMQGETLSEAEERRFAEIGDLILAQPDLWEDLVPEDPPLGHPTPPSRRPGRNEPCWCGSGRKYKHCHLDAEKNQSPENTL